MSVVTTFELALARRLATDARRRLRGRALARAYAAFAARHPRMAASLFDQAFLTGRGAAAVQLGDPAVLARAWTEQLPYPNEGARDGDVRRLEPVAREFLDLLAAEARAAGHARSEAFASPG